LKRHTIIGCFACVLSLTALSHAQAVPTASRGGSIQLGVGGMVLSPDYAQKYVKGLTFYGDFDFTHNIGVEGEIHYSVLTPTDLSENSYLIGPRYTLSHKRLAVYGKVLFGLGRFGTQGGSFGVSATSSYADYAFGGGVEYKVTHNINIRAFDIELQKWPGFPPNGLSPIVYTFGAAYVLH
jgi:opacity protein-like surface antigen